MIPRLTAVCGALALLFTLGCGNKGPLFLPQPEASAPKQQQTEESDKN